MATKPTPKPVPKVAPFKAPTMTAAQAAVIAANVTKLPQKLPAAPPPPVVKPLAPKPTPVPMGPPAPKVAPKTAPTLTLAQAHAIAPKLYPVASPKSVVATKQPTNKPLVGVPKVVKPQTPLAKPVPPNVLPQAPAPVVPAPAPPASVVRMLPPNSTPTQPALPQNQYQAQQAQPTGLGAEYDGVYGAEVARENARGQAFSAELGNVDNPNKDEFTTPWDQTDQNFEAEYQARKARMAAQWEAQQAQLDSEYRARQAQIQTAQQGALGSIATATGVAGVNAQQYGAPTPVQANGIDPNQYLSGLGAAGANQLAQVQGAPERTANFATSGLTPEVIAALQSQYNGVANANASSAQSSATSANSAALQRAYASQGDIENGLLDVFGKNTNANTDGRITALDKYYGANQGASKTRGELLDKQYAASAANKQAMMDIASGGRNAADNVQSNTNNIRTTDTTARGQDIASGDRIQVADQASADRRYGVDVASGDRRYGVDVRSTTSTKAAKAAAPKFVKGDEYVATALSKSPKTATLVRTINQQVDSAIKTKKLADGSDNPLYGRSPEDVLAKYWAQHPDQAKTARVHVEAYRYGTKVAVAPTGGGSTGSNTTSLKNANQLKTDLAKLGVRVDGINASSAQHKVVNPKSGHDTGKAADVHVAGQAAVDKLISEAKQRGIKYLIHDNKIYEAKNGFKPKYYGGTFSNGQRKDDHKKHIHVEFL